MASIDRRILLGAALAAAAGIAAPAHAGSLVGLVDGKGLVTIDTDSRKVTRSVTVSGVPGLIGIDVRPADGMVYGLTADGWVVTVDPATGKATPRVKLKAMLPAEVAATVDFNPVADRLRVMGSDGTNLRANVDDGAVATDGMLKFAAADMHKGETPNIVAGAYTNSFNGTKETVLYDLDATIGGLIKQAPPNDGVLNAVGKLGVALSGPLAFDIASDGMGGNTGWLVAGWTLHKVDLATGKATAMGRIEGGGGNVMDIAALPAN